MKRVLIVIIFILVTVGDYWTTMAQPPFIQIISPNGGESFEVGSTRRIIWRSSGVNSVMLYLTNPKGGIVSSDIGNVTGNPGYIYWTIPNDILPGNYKILIAGCAVMSGCTYYQKIDEDISDAPFKIIQSPDKFMGWSRKSCPTYSFNITLRLML